MQACNVFWQVDTASIGTTADFVGTILALNSITVDNGATIEGRLLARNGNVTLINDTITVPVCADTETPDDTDIIPGVPNTGAPSGNGPWIVVSASAAIVVLMIVAVIFKKHSI